MIQHRERISSRGVVLKISNKDISQYYCIYIQEEAVQPLLVWEMN